MATEITPILKRAEEMFAKQQYEYAISLFRQCLAQDPNNEKAHRGLALSASKKSAAAGGSGRFKTTVMMTKTLSQLKVAGKNTAKKIEMCLNHLVDDPNSEQSVKIRLELAQAYHDAGHFAGGAAEAQLACEMNPKSPDAFKILGVCKKEAGEIMAAQEALQKALALNPSDRDCGKFLRDLAALESMEKSNIETAAKKDFRAALKDKDSAKELESAQHLLRSAEDVETEINKCKKDLEAEPNDYRIMRKIGDLYADRKKDHETAAVWYEKAAAANPQDSTLRDKMDDMKIRAIDKKIADAVKAADPKVNELRVGKLKFEMASYERRAKDRPTDLMVKFELGKRYLLAGAGYLDKAISEFQLATKDPKVKMDAHVYLGLSFQKKKMFDLAVSQYEKAQESGFVPPERLKNIQYNLALCYHEAGNLDKAIEVGKRILTEDIGYKDMSALVEKWTGEKK